MICSFCGKDTKTAGHIMAQCMALHNNRLSIKEDQKQTHGDIAPVRLSIKGKQLASSLSSKGPDRVRLFVKGDQGESQKRPTFNTMLDNLRRVPMGQFLRNAVKEMEHLPFVLTRDGVAIAIVGPYNEVGR